jgi:predicted ATPase with chaperone activity
VTHKQVESSSNSIFKTDARWVCCRRPTVVVGGEMTLDMLDLNFNPVLKYYEAPLQFKANNGLFLVDDFGRQRIAPQELLNRWIIPMENRRDYLCLHTGQKFVIPFDQLIIFSTNLDPQTLVDAAFLRRLRHKIKLDHVSREQFRAIFQITCQRYQVAYDDQVVSYLLEKHYDPESRSLDACHPRDLIEQIQDIARYQEIPALLTRENIDQACKNYFVS